MKSSITTTSVALPFSVPPTTRLPLVIRTREMRSPALKATPRNESPLLAAGRKNVPSDALFSLKNSMLVRLARSTSVKTAPNPLTVATVSGFGAVFTDEDLANLTSIEFFNENNASLGTFFLPAANNGLSFLGVAFNAGERISRVRITSGNLVVGGTENGSATDVVVMDDFIYGEPPAVPEPTTMLLLGTSLVGLAAKVRRRRASN